MAVFCLPCVKLSWQYLLLQPVCEISKSLSLRSYLRTGGSFTISCFLALHAIVVNGLAFKIIPKVTPQVDVNVLFNLVGTVQMTLFVGTCKDVFSFFECFHNPTVPWRRNYMSRDACPNWNYKSSLSLTHTTCGAHGAPWPLPKGLDGSSMC